MQSLARDHDHIISIESALDAVHRKPGAPEPLSVADAERWLADARAELDEAKALNALLDQMPPTPTKADQRARKDTVWAVVGRVQAAKVEVAQADAALKAAYNALPIWERTELRVVR